MNDFFELGLSQDGIKMLALDIFNEWEDTINGEYHFTKCTREVRALACYRAILSATKHLESPHLPWTLFQILYPEDETSGLLRTQGKNFVQSITDWKTKNFPAMVRSLEAFRKRNLETYTRRRAKWIGDGPPSDEQLLQRDEGIISKIYHADMDMSTVAQTIGKPGIGLCYYTLYKNYKTYKSSEMKRKAILDSLAPRGSSKQDVLSRKDDNLDRNSSRPVESHHGELKDQDVIQSFCESVRHVTLPDDLEQGKTKPNKLTQN